MTRLWALLGQYLRRLRKDPLLLPFYIPAFVVFLGSALLTPVLPLYAHSFGVSYVWVGALLSAQALGMLLADVPSGLVLRRLGQRRAMVFGIAAVGLTTLGLSQTRSIYGALLYRLASGFGVALFGVSRHAYATQFTKLQNRGRALALLGGLMRVGRLLGPAAGGAIADAAGLRAALLLSALLTFPAVLSVLLFAPTRRTQRSDLPDDRRERQQLLNAHGSIWQLVRRQAAVLIPAGMGQVFAQMIRSGRSAVIPLYASEVLGLGVQRIGLLLSIAAALEVLMSLPAGWLMDHRGRKYALVPSFALQAVGMACVPLTSTFASLLGCVGLVGLGNGLSSGGMMTLGSDLAPPGRQGEFLGLWRLIGDMGGTIGPTAVGTVAESFALPYACLTMAGAGLMAALIFGIFLPETRPKAQEALSTGIP